MAWPFVNCVYCPSMSGRAAKRKAEPAAGSSTKRPKRELDFEEVSSASEAEEVAEDSGDEETELVETADEKRLRLTKEYLAELDAVKRRGGIDVSEDEEEAQLDDAEVADAVGVQLKRDALELAGKLHSAVAKQLKGVTLDPPRIMRGHKLPVTALAISSDDATAFTGSKDASIIRWDVETGKKSFVIRRSENADAGDGHTGEVLAIAVSSDGRYLASGGRDKYLRVWDARTGARMEAFKGHRDAISCLAFRRNTSTLYSGSLDRSIKHWNLTEMAYVESLFGHQSDVTGLDALLKEECISVGRDKTARLWKVAEESHLVFRAPDKCISMSCLAMLNQQMFVSGAEDGSLSLWSTLRKKPLCTEIKPHGEHWIASVAAMRGSDLVASGSGDGVLRLWHANPGDRSRPLTEVATATVTGFVNAMQFSKSGRFLLAGVGQEHRLGRWWKNREARNGLQLIELGIERA